MKSLKNFYKHKHKGETLLEFLIASVIFAIVLAMTVEFVLSKVKILTFLRKDDEYMFNAHSMINYITDRQQRERALEFLLNNSKYDIEFKRDNNDGVFLKVYLKSSSTPIFEIKRGK